MRKFVLDIQTLALRNEIEILIPDSGEFDIIFRSYSRHPIQSMFLIKKKNGIIISFVLGGIFWPKIIDWNSNKCIDLTWKEYYAIIKYANTKILDNNDIANGYAKMLEDSERKIMEKGK